LGKKSAVRRTFYPSPMLIRPYAEAKASADYWLSKASLSFYLDFL
jgi:hypothetical protein